MGGCFIYILHLVWPLGRPDKIEKIGDAEPWKNLIRYHHRTHLQIKNIINKCLINFVQRAIQ